MIRNIFMKRQPHQLLQRAFPSQQLLRRYCASIQPQSTPTGKEEHNKNTFQNLKNKFSPMIKSSYGKVVSALVAISFIGDIGYAYLVQRNRERNIREAFETGSTIPIPNVEHEIVREKELNQVKSILQTSAGSSRYTLITGEHGTGKTTLVLQACRKIGVGCIYVDVSQRIDDQTFDSLFGAALGKAINFQFDEYISFTGALTNRILGPSTQNHPLQTQYDRVEDVLIKAAVEFKERHNRPPVLIIDNINRLAEKSPRMLTQLQQLAKDHADKKDLIIVFVTSEGKAPRMLEENSSWSRANRPYEITDIDDTSAQLYLQNRGVTEEDAKRAVTEITGGRFHLLDVVARAISKGTSYEGSYYNVQLFHNTSNL
eukprot:TRINITY_DN3884_c0_g1_i4.p1 TRINITY_DN3884_c0_g1~~TRINITY_DN3884_c0_g1_i4.p1  ORF type:complete len:372 (+),score=47.72 TRINITY_DN3884_c0_g1_i4:78-1193(+)